jgi:hypothetical protein
MAADLVGLLHSTRLHWTRQNWKVISAVPDLLSASLAALLVGVLNECIRYLYCYVANRQFIGPFTYT